MTAIREAALIRFRPIIMTTLAALLGSLPIALGAGAGAELRQPLGIAIVGGLCVSQVLTLYITPVVYIYLDKVDSLLAGRRKKVVKSAPHSARAWREPAAWGPGGIAPGDLRPKGCAIRQSVIVAPKRGVGIVRAYCGGDVHVYGKLRDF